MTNYFLQIFLVLIVILIIIYVIMLSVMPKKSLQSSIDYGPIGDTGGGHTILTNIDNMIQLLGTKFNPDGNLQFANKENKSDMCSNTGYYEMTYRNVTTYNGQNILVGLLYGQKYTYRLYYKLYYGSDGKPELSYGVILSYKDANGIDVEKFYTLVAYNGTYLSCPQTNNVYYNQCHNTSDFNNRFC